MVYSGTFEDDVVLGTAIAASFSSLIRAPVVARDALLTSPA